MKCHCKDMKYYNKNVLNSVRTALLGRHYGNRGKKKKRGGHILNGFKNEQTFYNFKNLHYPKITLY